MNYSETDSDSTVEETLVMLNFPQLNNDENKLKNLSVFRKKNEEKFHLLNENEIKTIRRKKNENFKRTLSPNNLSKQKTDNEINNIEIDLTKDSEHKETLSDDNTLPINKEENIVTHNSCDILEDNKSNSNREMKNKMNETVTNENSNLINESNKDVLDKEKKNYKKNENSINDNIVDNIPFAIGSITLKNVFTENPQCVINNKYKFKGIQTSSIGTNLYFKEPESLKNKNNLKNYEILYDDVNRNIRNESKLTRDDFAIYEGHSTKIISFEIDC